MRNTANYSPSPESPRSEATEFVHGDEVLLHMAGEGLAPYNPEQLARQAVSKASERTPETSSQPNEFQTMRLLAKHVIHWRREAQSDQSSTN